MNFAGGSWRRLVLRLASGLAGAALLVASGCGGNAELDSAALEQRIERERTDAAATAEQEQQIEALEEEVEELRPEGASGDAPAPQPAEAAPSPASGSSPGGSADGAATFFIGNVSCRVTDGSAACTVAAISATFSFDGAPAQRSPGEVLPRRSGFEASWGTTVSRGSTSCRIPNENEPRGVTCSDSSSGHGFEASRHASRQRLF
jgi:hypothetical protein